MLVSASRWLFLAAASWFDISATAAFPAPWYPIRLTSSKSQRWFCRPNRAPALVESRQNGCALWGRSRWLGVKPGANRSYHSDFKPDEPFGAARRQSGANHSAQSGSSPGANRSGWLGVKLGVSPSARSDFNPDADHLGIRISSPPNHSKRSGSRLGEPSGAIRLQPRRKPLKAARLQPVESFKAVKPQAWPL